MPSQSKNNEHQVADNVFAFTGTEVNWVILQEGTELTLIDAGWERDIQEVERSIRSLGRGPEDLRAILLTHAHADHTGALNHPRRVRCAAVDGRCGSAQRAGREDRDRRPDRRAQTPVPAAGGSLGVANSKGRRSPAHYQVRRAGVPAGRPAGSGRTSPVPWSALFAFRSPDAGGFFDAVRPSSTRLP